MNLSDVTGVFARLTVGRVSAVFSATTVVLASLYIMGDVEFSLSTASTWIEQASGCDRTVNVMKESLDTHDIQSILDSDRQGDCFQKEFIEKAESNARKGLDAADPASPPSFQAPADLIDSTKRLNSAFSENRSAQG